MSPTAVPTKITIDFRDSALPSRTWILGVDGTASDRMELIAFETESPRSSSPSGTFLLAPAAVLADCACPEFCERDHANE